MDRSKTASSEESSGKLGAPPTAAAISAANSAGAAIPDATSLPVDLGRSILLAQLSECWNDVRNVDSLVWQLPTGIGAILGLVLTSLAPHITSRPTLVEVTAVFGASLVTLALVVAPYKNRISQISRSRYIKSLYAELLLTRSCHDRQSVPIKLSPDDHDIENLPGLVALSSKDLIQLGELQKIHPLRPISPSSFLHNIRSKFSRKTHDTPAFSVLFRVSIFVFIGEFF